LVVRSVEGPYLEIFLEVFTIKLGGDLYNGLPFPKGDTLENGVEYYFTKDNQGFINVLYNKFDTESPIDVINPFCKAMYRIPQINTERIAMINSNISSAIYEAPENHMLEILYLKE